MSSENLDTKKLKLKQTEADFAATNLGMQDRVKIDDNLGTLESKEKALKPGNEKLIGPN